MAIGVPELLGANVGAAGRLFTFSEQKSAVLINNKGTGLVAFQLGAIPANANPGDGKFTLVNGKSKFFAGSNIISIGARAAAGQNANIDMIGLAEAKGAGLDKVKRRGITLSRLRMIFGTDAYNQYLPAGWNFNIPPFGAQNSGALALGGADIDTNAFWGCHVAVQVNEGANVPVAAGNLIITATLSFLDATAAVVGAPLTLPTFQTVSGGGIADALNTNSDCLFIVPAGSGVITNFRINIISAGATGFETGNYAVTPIMTWFKR